MDAEGGTGEVSRRACISGTDGSACCLPDVLAGNVVLKGLRLINRAYREDIVIFSASPIHLEGMGGVIDEALHTHRSPRFPHGSTEVRLSVRTSADTLPYLPRGRSGPAFLKNN